MKLKIVSWNIWCYGYFKKIADFLKKADADIICLQEVIESAKEENISTFLANLGYKHIYADSMQITKDGKNVFMGNATYSKYPILSSKVHVLSKEDKRIALEANIQIGESILHIFNTHLTHEHLMPSSKRATQVDNLIKVLPKEKVLVMGDFNTTQVSREIKKLSKILNNSDKTFAPTWSVYPQGCEGCKPQKVEHRLDYIFASHDIKVKSAKVDYNEGSDHLPVSIDVELEKM